MTEEWGETSRRAGSGPIRRAIRVEVEQFIHRDGRALQFPRAPKDLDHGASAHLASCAYACHRLPSDSGRRLELRRGETVVIEPSLKTGRITASSRLRRGSTGLPPLLRAHDPMLSQCAAILACADIAVKNDILRPSQMRISSVLPPPDAGIRSIGATIRAVRVARGLTQQRMAKEANVSRAQLALLEQGGNVSIRFLLKVARFLELTTIPLDGTVELTSGGREGLNVFDLLQSLDLLAALVERVRAFAMTAVLPPSERATLRDSLALGDFVAKHFRDDVSVQRLANAIVRLSDDTPAGATTPRVDAGRRTHAKRSSREEKR